MFVLISFIEFFVRFVCSGVTLYWDIITMPLSVKFPDEAKNDVFASLQSWARSRLKVYQKVFALRHLSIQSQTH